jgi:hypothetical protein
MANWFPNGETKAESSTQAVKHESLSRKQKAPDQMMAETETAARTRHKTEVTKREPKPGSRTCREKKILRGRNETGAVNKIRWEAKKATRVSEPLTMANWDPYLGMATDASPGNTMVDIEAGAALSLAAANALVVSYFPGRTLDATLAQNSRNWKWK